MADSLIAAAAAAAAAAVVAVAFSCDQFAQPGCVCFADHCPAVLYPNLPQECTMFIATTASCDAVFSRQGMTCMCAVSVTHESTLYLNACFSAPVAITADVMRRMYFQRSLLSSIMSANVAKTAECVHEQAKETLVQQQPPEVRILKHLLRIQSPQERQTALQDAFAPGADLQTEEQDLLST